jgi:hypothetical protein
LRLSAGIEPWVLVVTTTIVWPSAGACFAAMTPIMPVAPLRLSMTIDQPCCAPIHCAMSRGMPSYGPPAG